MIADIIKSGSAAISNHIGRVEQVRAGIERLILAGDLPPGHRLNELALSARFGVSRGPVREAVRALEEARLVELVPNRGAFVRRVGLREALELFEVRAGFARTAGRLLALRANRAQIGELRDIHRRLDITSAAHDRAGFHELNIHLHDRLMAITGNPRLREMDLMIRNELQLYLRHNVSSATQLKVSNKEHGAILKAIDAGDPDAAGIAFETHVLNGKQRLLHSAPDRSVS